MNARAHISDEAGPELVLMSGHNKLVQRKCACGGTPGLTGECDGCRRKRLTLQRRSDNRAEPSTVPSIVQEVLQSPGQPLDADTRAFMEPRFGHDFSQVRVHTDKTAADSARAVSALAYAVGRDVVFGAGQYAPESRRGQFILAHELAHVVQQSQVDESAEIDGTGTVRHEREADAAAYGIASRQQTKIPGRMLQPHLQKIDLTPDFLDQNDIDPKAAVASNDYVDNNIDNVGLREEWSGLTVRFIAVTVKYKDGSLMDIPINSTHLQSPNPAGKMQVIRFRKHTPTGKIVPVTWRGSPEELPETPGDPLGSVIFAKDITPNIMTYYDLAIVHRASVFAGEIAAIWGAALGARSLIQMFSATQAAAITAAGRGAAGAGTAAARQAALREAQRQTLESEKKALIQQLKAAGVKFAEKDIIQIVRTTSGKIAWLEKGSTSAGLEHIMVRHGNQFAKLGVVGEENVSKLIMDTLKTKLPIRTNKGGEVFSVLMGGTEREMNVIVGSNGFVVTAYPL